MENLNENEKLPKTFKIDAITMLLSQGNRCSLGFQSQRNYNAWCQLSEDDKRRLSIYARSKLLNSNLSEWYEAMITAFIEWDHLQNYYGACGWDCKAAVNYLQISISYSDVYILFKEAQEIWCDYTENVLNKSNSQVCHQLDEELMKENVEPIVDEIISKAYQMKLTLNCNDDVKVLPLKRKGRKHYEKHSMKNIQTQQATKMEAKSINSCSDEKKLKDQPRHDEYKELTANEENTITTYDNSSVVIEDVGLIPKNT